MPPGDLSVSMGRTGALTDPELIQKVVEIVTLAKSLGKRVGIMAGPGPLFDAAVQAGCDFVFCGGDITDLIPAWRGLLSTGRDRSRKG